MQVSRIADVLISRSKVPEPANGVFPRRLSASPSTYAQRLSSSSVSMSSSTAARKPLTATDSISQPITLPCGLTLPNRLVKCPMQETLAEAPFYDPPIDKFAKLYGNWGQAGYGLLITGQVQIDIRFLSIAGDVVCRSKSLEEPHFSKWKAWAQMAQANGTPTIVQLAHPGRMSPAGDGERPTDMQTLCPSCVHVKLGDSWIDKMSQCGCMLQELPKRPASQVSSFMFLSPHTNRRTDEYGGTPEKRLRLLQRLVTEIRKICPHPFCLSVKLNCADYITYGGLTQDEGLEQVRWLLTCGMVDMVEVSGGNAENKTSKLHNSFGLQSLKKAPKRSDRTRIREAYFIEFAERLETLKSKVPIQLSGGFRSRSGMADAIESGSCYLIGLGRTAVLQSDLPKSVLLNPNADDDTALAMPHKVKGQWFANLVPVKVVGSGLAIQFFYYNMRRIGNGMKSDPNASIPSIVFGGIWETLRTGLLKSFQRVFQGFPA